MRVMKFGGSSVGTPDRIRQIEKIVRAREKEESVVVVVSAFQAVTNELLQCAAMAESGDPAYGSLFNTIADRHRSALRTLHGSKPDRKAAAAVDALLEELEELLKGIRCLSEVSPRASDLVASFGERLSSTIIASFMNRSKPAVAVDSRQFVLTDDAYTRAAVQFPQTNARISAFFRKLKRAKRFAATPVVTGFIGSTAMGVTTTIGRNGSDYTAAIVGGALRASAVEIWTDVDGVLSADPKAVENAFVLPQMSYEEAMELSYFGARVLQAEAIAPVVRRGIPLLIKNTFKPGAPGTLISKDPGPWKGVAKGITTLEDITLLDLRGSGMVGVPGTAERLFRALARAEVNVIMISQASSEHTICFAVSSKQAEAAKAEIQQEFRYEFSNNLVILDSRAGQTLFAVVGEGMRGTPGVSGRVFQTLGRNNINIGAIAQGGSERNISFAVNSENRTRALHVIHEAFFEQRKKLGLVVVGVGNIGRTLIDQVRLQHANLLARGFDLRVVAVADSKRFAVDPGGLPLQEWRARLDGSPHTMNPQALLRSVEACRMANVALVDCTASQHIVDAYPDFVLANVHIVTPNKRANVLPWARYESLMSLLKSRQRYFLYEANVGAGLPIISTLQDLIHSGDRILRIEGVFSGTLSFLFNTYDGQRPFSECVAEAKAMGYTEPDPREDLSGEDVARKLLILARQLGHKLDLKDVRVESLIPPKLRSGPLPRDFFARYAAVDNVLKKRFEAARRKGAVLRYAGSFSGGRARAAVIEVSQDQPLARTSGSDNIIAFTTERYAKTPLVVQGPGAGAEVTATGVFSDILKLLHYLPD